MTNTEMDKVAFDQANVFGKGQANDAFAQAV